MSSCPPPSRIHRAQLARRPIITRARDEPRRLATADKASAVTRSAERAMEVEATNGQMSYLCALRQGVNAAAYTPASTPERSPLARLFVHVPPSPQLGLCSPTVPWKSSVRRRDEEDEGPTKRSRTNSYPSDVDMAC